MFTPHLRFKTTFFKYFMDQTAALLIYREMQKFKFEKVAKKLTIGSLDFLYVDTTLFNDHINFEFIWTSHFSDKGQQDFLLSLQAVPIYHDTNALSGSEENFCWPLRKWTYLYNSTYTTSSKPKENTYKQSYTNFFALNNVYVYCSALNKIKPRQHLMYFEHVICIASVIN